MLKNRSLVGGKTNEIYSSRASKLTSFVEER